MMPESSRQQSVDAPLGAFAVNSSEVQDKRIAGSERAAAETRRTNIRAALLRLYWRIEGLLVPGHKYSQYLYEDVLKSYVMVGVKWLDVGCGHGILPPWRAEEERHLVERCRMVAGIDYSLDSLRRHETLSAVVNGDVTNLPFVQSAFGLVTANMVVEHLHDPEGQFREINRVLEPGGLFVFHTPNVLGYTAIISRLMPERLKKAAIRVLEARGDNDVFPTFYRANSRRRITQLAATAGFEVLRIKMTLSCATFALCPPLAVPELIWIRILRTRPFKAFRTNMVVILRKQASPAIAVARSTRANCR